MRAPERGFTLIELIVGIVLLAVALTGILGLLINQAPQAVDPVQQVRAAQLAQRLAGEIQQTSFDEQSDHNGGRYRCGEVVAGVTIQACSTHYGPDGEPAPTCSTTWTISILLAAGKMPASTPRPAASSPATSIATIKFGLR
ncbi:MSHA biogenesis protein MshD [Aeromonas hydrophila]|nr:MSHA biogenesis protein MshD [Aeromonas hydrophila]